MTTGEWWAYGSALVVLIGVVGESIADLTAIIKSEDRKKKLAKMSALVLILGLAGDVVSIRMTQLATASLNAEAAQANERAGKAEERAGEAEARAANAEAELEDAKKEAAVARKDAEAFRAQIAQANERAAQAELRASRAQLDLARFKAPRTLTPEQQNTLVEVLSSFSKVGVDVFIFGDTPEITRISGTILNCMAKAKWDLHYATVLGGSGIAVTGIVVGVSPSSDPVAQKGARALVATLDSMGVDSKMVPFDRLQFPGGVGLAHSTVAFGNPNPVRVFIGSKR